MPNGRTHDIITLTCAVIGGSLVLYDTGEWRVATVYTVTTLVSGLLLSPDLDLHSDSYVRWGTLRLIWYPYQKALPHRHILSHGIIIGLVVRVIYMHAMIGGLIALACWFWDAIWMAGNGVDLSFFSLVWTEIQWVYGIGKAFYQSISGLYLLAAILGLLTGSESHILADHIWSALRPKKGNAGSAVDQKTV